MSSLGKLLDTIESFIEEELEVRKNSFMPNPDSDELDDIDSAETALRCIREARSLTGNLTPQTEVTEKKVVA